MPSVGSSPPWINHSRNPTAVFAKTSCVRLWLCVASCVWSAATCLRRNLHQGRQVLELAPGRSVSQRQSRSLAQLDGDVRDVCELGGVTNNSGHFVKPRRSSGAAGASQDVQRELQTCVFCTVFGNQNAQTTDTSPRKNLKASKN